MDEFGIILAISLLVMLVMMDWRYVGEAVFLIAAILLLVVGLKEK